MPLTCLAADMFNLLFLSSVTLLCLETGASDLQTVTLRCYSRSFLNYTTIPLFNATNLLAEECYASKRSNVFYAFGYKGSPTGPATEAVVGALLDTQKYNVILIDWQEMASPGNRSLASGYLYKAVPNVNKLSAALALVLENLTQFGLALKNTWLVGHSLGAQLFGQTGSRLKNKGFTVSRITGLDPARILYEPLSVAAGGKVASGSADVVELVHSDPGGYGYRNSHGDIDYWPNPARVGTPQPGCPTGAFARFTPEDLCSHNRAWVYFAEALSNPGSFLASRAATSKYWANYSAIQRSEDVIVFGEEPNKKQSGNYYFTTNAEPPYGRGDQGLHP